ncbi:hypothetical protein MSG28_000560 [Choristoneura fumiferana]|uniref:Uncharacterized protein n=1 Tax=Choristoneura fumiferana TaxID=7141 RepID=A0ACC0K1A3_CHOFU|nr:hypothetical protein MSG28_000560 [Choristoneura fumiferana]
MLDGKEKDHEDNENEAEENDDSHFNDEHFAEVGRERDEHEKNNGDAASGSAGHGDSDSDDSDDVKVTIGDIKAGPQAYASLNIKRGVGLVAAGAGEKPRAGAAPAPGKVTLEDLDGPGSINGVPALEFNIDTIEDKPWNKPGADISDKVYAKPIRSEEELRQRVFDAARTISELFTVVTDKITHYTSEVTIHDSIHKKTVIKSFPSRCWY